MQVIFCGTSSGGRSFNPERANASILVEAGGDRVLLDSGPGSLERLVRAGRSVADVDAVFLSHLHHDHILALPELVMRRSFPGGGGLLPVFGPAGTQEFMSRVGHLMELLVEGRPTVTLQVDGTAQEVPAGESVTVGHLTATCVEVAHAPELQCFGWKLRTDDRSVVYSGDTAPIPEVMVPLAQDADLLIHDAYSDGALARQLDKAAPEMRDRLAARLPTTHSEARAVGRIAQAAAVKHLALTSIFPAEDTTALAQLAAEEFSGPISVAYDGLALEV
jgi:ribonuclease Z